MAFKNGLLKELRKNAGFTQVKMAELIGVARTTYAEYEQGKIQPPLENVSKIARVLNTDISEFTGATFIVKEPTKTVIWQRELAEFRNLLNKSTLPEQDKEFLRQNFIYLQLKIWKKQVVNFHYKGADTDD